MDQESPEPLKQIRPEVAEAETAASDSSDPAVKEALQLNSGKSTSDLERQIEHDAKRAEAGRDQNFRNHFERLAILSMYVIFTALCVIGVAWLSNILLPECCAKYYIFGIRICRWLTPDQTTILQDILTGGLIGGLLADHFRKRIGR